MSNLTPRGTIRGVIRSGGGGGVTDYDQLTGRPQINSNLLTGDKGGHDLGLMNTNDINITKITDLTYGTNYDLTILGENVHITDQVFQPAGVSSNGTKGLVPRPSAGDTGKILSNEGWIDPPESYTPPNYSTSEQKTGQKWIDGKDIYFKTYILSNIASNPGDWTLIDTISGVDEIINSHETFKYSNSNITYGQYYVSTSYRHATNGLYYYIREIGGGSGELKTTIFYTKN